MKGKARVSCKDLADQDGVNSKNHLKRGGVVGGGAASFHVRVSRAIEKGKTFISIQIKMKVIKWEYLRVCLGTTWLIDCFDECVCGGGLFVFFWHGRTDPPDWTL